MIEGFGPATIRAHLERIRADRRPIGAGLSQNAFTEARRKVAAGLSAASRIGARCIVDGDADYPAGLHALEHAPIAVWVIGDIDIVRDTPAVAIVGTRACTPYGERVAREIAGAMARAGATVVSGMALGIDAMAHRSALAASGRTAAVLGTGVDVPYPASHRSLHGEICNRGVVISEKPPGTKASPGCFPRRNRIIAALGAATIVVEAGVQSGAIITAEMAQAIGRTLAIVPGPIDSPQSLGSNALMRDGGHPITCVADALALLGLSQARPADIHLESPAERKVWQALDRPAADFNVVCARTGLPARVCFETVTTLELRGLVECSLTGGVRRR